MEDKKLEPVSNSVNQTLLKGGDMDVGDAVLAAVAFKEAIEIDGVVKVEGRDKDEILNHLRRGAAPKGLHLEKNANEVAIKMHLVVNYGSSIPNLANQLRQKVVRAIVDLTGFHLHSLDIFITGVIPEN